MKDELRKKRLRIHMEGLELDLSALEMSNGQAPEGWHYVIDYLKTLMEKSKKFLYSSEKINFSSQDLEQKKRYEKHIVSNSNSWIVDRVKDYVSHMEAGLEYHAWSQTQLQLQLQYLGQNRVSIQKALPNYEHATIFHLTRDHINTVTTAGMSEDFRNRYQTIKGDALKTAILFDFKHRIEKVDTLAALQELANDFKKTEEYEILEKRQGAKWLNYIPGLKTDSVRAFEAMIDEKKQALQTPKLKNS